MNPSNEIREWSSTESLPEGFADWLKEIVSIQEVELNKIFRTIAGELGVDPSLLGR
jgi:hypothetical protein